MNIKNITHSKRSHRQESTYCIIPLLGNDQNKQIYIDRRQISGCRRLEDLGKKVKSNGYGISFGDDENVLKLLILHKSVNILKPTELNAG